MPPPPSQLSPIPTIGVPPSATYAPRQPIGVVSKTFTTINVPISTDYKPAKPFISKTAPRPYPVEIPPGQQPKFVSRTSYPIPTQPQVTSETEEVLFGEYSSKIDEKQHINFQFNLYAKKISFDKKMNKIVVEDYSPESVIFEVKSPQHPRGMKYITEQINTQSLIDEWKLLFPTYEAQPNAIINGFTKDHSQRKILTVTLSSPKIDKSNRILFDYNIDQFYGNLDLISGRITQWDGSEPIYDVSIMIDFVSTLKTLASSAATKISSIGTSLKSSVTSGISKVGKSVSTYLNQFKGPSANPIENYYNNKTSAFFQKVNQMNLEDPHGGFIE